MSGFTLGLPPKITFGPGTAGELAPAVAALGSRVLVVTGSAPARWAHLTDALGPADRVLSFPVSREPDVDLARDAARVGREFGAEVVIGLGGGSVMDLAKAAAMLLANGGDPLDYIEVVGRGEPIRERGLPMIAVPTTAGTGAEVTANAVLGVPEHRVKVSLRSPLMLPVQAIVDPELTLACPPVVTAASGMDALTQCLEPYVSNRANPVTDGWARTGLVRAGRGLRAAFADGSDLAARTDMALASLLGGLSLANAKLGAVHGFAGVLGGMSQAPHGAICAALLVPVCRANLEQAAPDLRARFDDVARWLTADRTASAEDGLAWLDQTRAELGIPGLAGFGLTRGDAAAVAALAARASSMAGNPVKLDLATLERIYVDAL